MTFCISVFLRKRQTFQGKKEVNSGKWQNFINGPKRILISSRLMSEN
jgi:hypothetical protein